MLNYKDWKDRLLFNDVLLGLVMLGLAIANYAGRPYAQRGTAQYIDRAGAGLLDILSALMVVCAFLLIRNAWKVTPLSGWDFALLTIPLLLYVGASILYTVDTRGPAQGVVIYIGFYILLVKRAIKRPKAGLDE